jgi:hypothetical protein
MIEPKEPIFPSLLNACIFNTPLHPAGGASILSPLSTTDRGTPTQLEASPPNRIAFRTQCIARIPCDVKEPFVLTSA